jgi:hypothetical protein
MPDAPLRTVVVNTTPIIALSIVGRLHLLQALYGEVWIPPAVHDEVMSGGGRPCAGGSDLGPDDPETWTDTPDPPAWVWAT